MLLMSILIIMNIQNIKYSARAYPQRLREIASPPNQLYLVGNVKLLEENDRPRVAIVGTRYPTDYGRRVTYQLASELAAAGAIIISGLALGIDAIAHEAATQQGAAVVAVQARGMDEIYPAENRELAKKILEYGGAIVSEYNVGVGAFKQNFIARNRIVSALSDAVLVTEANDESGTNHTVRFAEEQNKFIMAVPGNITSKRSAGPNNLLRKGATPVVNASDVLAQLNLKSGLHLKPIKAASREEGILIDLMKEGVSNSEELIARSGFSAAEFANLITLMEISGKVHNLGAGAWVLRY